MKLYDAKGNLYTVHFHKLEYTDHGIGPYGALPQVVQGVGCNIHPGPCTSDARPCATPGQVTGISVCNPTDKWSSFKGRKLAFQRAIKTFSRDLRSELWADFFRIVHIPIVPTYGALRKQVKQLNRHITHLASQVKEENQNVGHLEHQQHRDTEPSPQLSEGEGVGQGESQCSTDDPC